jgi:hypothetical protein
VGRSHLGLCAFNHSWSAAALGCGRSTWAKLPFHDPPKAPPRQTTNKIRIYFNIISRFGNENSLQWKFATLSLVNFVTALSARSMELNFIARPSAKEAVLLRASARSIGGRAAIYGRESEA